MRFSHDCNFQNLSKNKIAMTEIHELRKQIAVKYFELSKDGLVEQYTFNGVRKSIDLNSIAACWLLREAGLINSYKAEGGQVYVSYNTELNTPDHRGEHRQDCRTSTAYFDDFVSDTQFSQFDAIQCAAYYEKQERFRAAIIKETNRVLSTATV